MLKELLKKSKEQKDYPVFNLEIKRSKSCLHLREHDNTSRLIGEFIVYNSGRLERGDAPFLHTYKTNLAHCEDYIHFPNGRIVDVFNKNGKLRINPKFKNVQFTLEGLYREKKPTSSYKKENCLCNQMRLFNPDFQFNPISKHQETRIKLLENKYKRYVSDQ